MVLDPGHGGTAPGMVGPGGTREADMNLRVALLLAARLRRSGARVVLTRTADGDHLEPPVSLGEELQWRARLANHVSADLFVSLHHNATPDSLTPSELLNRNRSEVYHRMDDPAATEAGTRLLRSLGPLTRGRGNRLLPSNFAVLRHSAVPALLGEPFYLSVDLYERYSAHPDFPGIEARLYERAVTDFLERPQRPVLRLLAPFPGEHVTDPTLRVVGEVSPPDGRRLELHLDGHPVETPALAWTRGRFEAAIPLPSPGIHELRAAAFSLSGIASRAVSASFTASAPAAAVSGRFAPPPDVDPDRPRLVRLELRDRHGRRIADGTNVRMELAGQVFFAATRQGSVTLAVPAIPPPPLARVLADGRDRTVALEPSESGGGRWIWLEVRDASTGQTVPGAMATGVPEVFHDEKTGLLLARLGREGRRPEIAARGYVPAATPFAPPGDTATVALTPVAGGSLRGLKVGIDTAELEARAGELTDALLPALEAAGCSAEVRSEAAVAGRVRASNLRGDSIYLCLRTAAGPTRVHHYPSSQRGARLARAAAAHLGDAGTVESGDYVAGNTGATALIVHLSDLHLDRPASTAVALVHGLAEMPPDDARAASRPGGDARPLSGGIHLLGNGRLKAAPGGRAGADGETGEP